MKLAGQLRRQPQPLDARTSCRTSQWDDSTFRNWGKPFQAESRILRKKQRQQDSARGTADTPYRFLRLDRPVKGDNAAARLVLDPTRVNRYPARTVNLGVITRKKFFRYSSPSNTEFGKDMEKLRPGLRLRYFTKCHHGVIRAPVWRLCVSVGLARKAPWFVKGVGRSSLDRAIHGVMRPGEGERCREPLTPRPIWRGHFLLLGTCY